MSLTTLDEVRALVDTLLIDPDLMDLIDREEEIIAARIGPLAGSRTETFRDVPSAGTITLRRTTDAVSVTDDAVAVDATDVAIDGNVVRRIDDGTWTGTVVVTYTPNDTAKIRRVVTELVRFTVLDREAGKASEQIGDYSYTASDAQANAGTSRGALLRSLLPRQAAGSVRMRSSVQS